MSTGRIFLLVTLIFAAGIAPAAAAKIKPDCSGFTPTDEKEPTGWAEPPSGSCKVAKSTHDGVDYAAPDPKCTPGAINPTLKLSVLKHPHFSTKCERDKATSASRKQITYDWYGVDKPANNKGKKMVCELDHLISIEIGGADTIDNIWPQCGPSRVVLKNRYFKQKDMVEDYLAAQVRAGTMQLDDVQAGIAKNWTQYLTAARKYYATRKEPKDGG